MDVGGFFRGAFGPWRTFAIGWLIVALFLLGEAQVWAGLHDLDTDDAMRLVQVRDWLSGQGWFDVDQHRGWPAPGFSMHWSRIPDLGIAGLIGLFTLLLPASAAETAAMILWPLAQLGVALAATALIARSVGGRAAMAPAMLLFGLAGPAMWQFHPGRIDHHGLQMIGVLIMLAGLLRLRRSIWWGVLAALGGALSLAVGLEALVFWGLLCAAAGLILVFDPARSARAVGAFGLTTALATPALAFATNPARYVVAQVCDQAAAPVLALAAAGGLGLAAAALIAPRLTNPAMRLALVALGGGLGAAAFTLAGPTCVAGPFAQVDPRLGPIWLDHVQEAKALPELLARADPFGVAAAFLGAIGVAASAYLFWRRPALARQTALPAAMFLGALALLFVQMRGVAYAAAFASPIIGAALVLLARQLRIPPLHWGAAMLAGVILVVGAPFAARGIAGLAAPPAAPSRADRACFDPDAYRELAGLPAGLAAAPVDSGPFILLASPLKVMSAPYHRNAEGILAAHEILVAAPNEARRLAIAAGVDYVVMCRSGAALRMIRTAPDGLAARLDAGAAPQWLSPVGRAEGSVKIWRLQ
jgi:hypothetical protein